MKVSCSQESLDRGLSIVGWAAAPRSALPVLGNVMVSTDDGRLRLFATDLETGIACWVEAKVEEEGATTVPARLLAEFVSSLPPGQVAMSLDGDRELNLRCASFDTTFKGTAAGEFPLLPAVEAGSPSVRLEREALRRMIGRVAFAAAPGDDAKRPALAGVLVELEDGRLTMAASDSFRLALRSEPLPGRDIAPFRVIVPATSMANLAHATSKAAAGGEEDFVEVVPAPGRVFFLMPGVTVVSQLIEGRYPDYAAIIPREHATRTVVGRAAFLAAARAAQLFVCDAANAVQVQVEPGRLVVRAISAELGDYTGELEAQVEGEPVGVALSARYLIQALGAIEAEQVALSTTTADRQAVLQPVGEERALHVIMPMHLSEGSRAAGHS
jgi:DNA polymerase-3 subunit beta